VEREKSGVDTSTDFTIDDSFFLSKPCDFLARKFEFLSHTGRQIRLHMLIPFGKLEIKFTINSNF